MKTSIEAGANRVEVDSLGGKLTLDLSGTPILISVTRGDGKTGITHICTPIFGPDRKKFYRLNQHGNMRNEECEIVNLSDLEIAIHHPLTDQGYPTGITAELAVVLDELGATFQLKHTNTGTEKAALNAGLHFYFDAPKSYKGTVVNGQDVTQLIEENPDGAVIQLLEENTIQIQDKPVLMLTQEGFTNAMVWTGRNKETNHIDANYVCIEPVENDPTSDYFGSPESMLAPGQTRSSECTIRINQ